MMKKTMRKTFAAFGLAAALVVPSVAPVTIPVSNVSIARAAVSNGIIYDGEGEVKVTLSTGSVVVAKIVDCVPTITKDGTDIGYPYTTPHAGTLVIAEDDLLHMFWLTGHYIVIDLRTGKWLVAGQTSYDTAAMKVSYKKAANTKDASCVLGLTGKAIHTCIISNKYFYNETSNMMQLMTRAEFEALISGQPIATPTPAPSAAPATEVPATAMPTIVPATLAPTAVPATAAPTMVMPTMLPTFAPTTAPVPASQTPDVITTIDFSAYIEWLKNWSMQMTWQAYANIHGIANWQEMEMEYAQTHNVYDDNGNLIDSYTVKYTKKDGTATADATVSANGSLTAAGTESGSAKITGSATKKTYNNTNKKSKSKKAKKGKTKYYTIYPEGPKGAVNLTKSKNNKDSSVAGIRVDYTPKSLSKRYAYWDKEPYYGLVYAGFNNKGSVVIMVKQKGKYITYVLKRGKDKKACRKYKPKTFKGYDKVIKEKVRGNAIRLKNSKTKKYVDIANLVPKKLKKAKAKAKANK